MGWNLKRCLLLALLVFLPGLPLQSEQATTDDRLAQMTLEQRVAQMFMVSFYGAPMNESTRALFTQWQPGAVVLLPSNLGDPPAITRLTNEIQQLLVAGGAPPALIAVDQEGGMIARLKEGFTQWPVPSLLAATGDETLAFQYGQALATELRAVGINMNLAPVADLDTNPANPIIGRRSFGSDPALVAPIVAGVVRGMQSAGVIATGKHFPGHGDTSTDSHLTLPEIAYSQAFLEQRELIPFRAMMDAGMDAVMVAHISYPELDPTNNLPASLSYAITTGLLRDQMGFRGLAITDALDMDAIDTAYSPEAAALAAIQAGHDLILTGAHVGPETHARVMQAVVDAVREGTLSEERINQSALRVMQAKAAYGVLDWQPLPEADAASRIPLDAHAQLVDEFFRKGITVVHGGAYLPLPADTLMLYPATRYPLWQMCASASWRPQAIGQYPSQEEINAAVQTAALVEYVVVFSEDLHNNPQQQALLAALPADKLILIAIRSPYDLWHTVPTAGYIVTYSPLKQFYQPLCDILHGVQPAQGQLAISIN